MSWEEYSEILDNREYTVEDRANQLARGAETVRIAVGFFFVGGFELLAEDFENIKKVKLLIGHETSAKTIDSLKQTLSDDIGQFDQSETHEGIKKFYGLSQLDQVEIRIYSEDNTRFHPKLYLYRYPEDSRIKSLGSAIVGSSNLSASGLTGNIELNIEKRDSDSIRHLTSWFENFWNEAEEFSPELMKEILRDSQFRDAIDEVDRERRDPKSDEKEPLSKAEVISPYEVTKRFIVEQFPHEVNEGSLLEDISGEYDEKLPEFQQDAVRAARQPLERYNGVILADSVGLGKSYIGATITQEGTTEQDQVLIIGPNRLEDMWMREMFGEYSLDRDPEFDLRADATYISFSKLSRLSEKEIQRFQSYDYILIDEAHKLRNQGTKRYAKLQAIGRQGKKFVCLTATPVQNSVRDVDNIIKIFADDDDFDIELVDSPSDIFREYDRLSSQPDDELTAEDRDRIRVLQDQIETVMREVMISRDRDFIIDTYGDKIMVGGRPIKVPDRVPTKVTPSDPGLEDLYHDLVTTVAGALDDESDTGLNLPYLIAEKYDRDFDDEEELMIEYRGTAMLIAINLLKRLESSIAAFEASLTTLIEREQATRTIATGDFDTAQSRQQAINYLEDTLEDFRGGIEIGEVVEAIELMDEQDQEQLIQDIDSDLEQLRQLKERSQRVLANDGVGGSTEVRNDAKAVTLKQKLQQELSDEKVLIFSQYVPTIEYLFEEITGQDPEHCQVASFLGNKKTTVAFVHGNKYDDRLIDQFAPEGRNPHEAVTEDSEIDILLSTDVTGEGQNLQDARCLVNYDLHWNPMKMEQRIGRIDRITTHHDKLYIYNFVPIGNLRKHLGLLERLETKIQRIAGSVGYSAPIIDSAEERVQKSFTIYENLDEADFSDSEFEGIGSKYDDIRRRIQRFCERHDVSINELRETKADSAKVDSIQYFVNHAAGESAYMALTRLWYSTGRSEWRTTFFSKSESDIITLGGRKMIQNHSRKKSNEVSIFNMISSDDDTRYTFPTDEEENIRTFAADIDSHETWESEILSRSSKVTPTIQKMEKFCRRVSETESYDKETIQKAKEIIDELSCNSAPEVQKMQMSDYAEQELERIYRKRSRYGYKGVVARLHQKLTEEIELVPPERVTEADAVLFGDVQ